MVLPAVTPIGYYTPGHTAPGGKPKYFIVPRQAQESEGRGGSSFYAIQATTLTGTLSGCFSLILADSPHLSSV